MTTSEEPEQQLNFYSLPPELRNRIYIYTSAPEKPIAVKAVRRLPEAGGGWDFRRDEKQAEGTSEALKTYVNLVCTSKQINHEMRDEFFRFADFKVSFDSGLPEGLSGQWMWYASYDPFKDKIDAKFKAQRAPLKREVVNKMRRVSLEFNSKMNRETMGVPKASLQFNKEGQLIKCDWTVEEEPRKRRMSVNPLLHRTAPELEERKKKADEAARDYHSKTVVVFNGKTKDRSEKLEEVFDFAANAEFTARFKPWRFYR